MFVKTKPSSLYIKLLQHSHNFNFFVNYKYVSRRGNTAKQPIISYLISLVLRFFMVSQFDFNTDGFYEHKFERQPLLNRGSFMANSSKIFTGVIKVL